MEPYSGAPPTPPYAGAAYAHPPMSAGAVAAARGLFVPPRMGPPPAPAQSAPAGKKAPRKLPPSAAALSKKKGATGRASAAAPPPPPAQTQPQPQPQAPIMRAPPPPPPPPPSAPPQRHQAAGTFSAPARAPNVFVQMPESVHVEESNHDNWSQQYGSQQDWSQAYGYSNLEEEEDMDDEGEGIVRGRGPSYTIDEDVWLCKTYCKVGMDAAVGTDQSKDAYWLRMKEYFDNINTYPKKERIERTDRSLRSRWAIIQTECQKWAGCLASTDALNPSGHNDVDRVNIAQNLYKGKGKKNKKGIRIFGKSFTLQHAYAALENEEKWKSRKDIRRLEEKKNKILDGEGVDDDDDASSAEEGNKSPTANNSVAKTKRPIGRKQAKENKKRGGEDPLESHMKLMVEARLAANEQRLAAKEAMKMAEDRKVAAEERLAAVEERKAALEEKKWQADETRRRLEYEKSIFFMDMSTLDPQQKEYIKMCREEILAQKKMSSTGFGSFGTMGASSMGGFGSPPPMGTFGSSLGGATGGFGSPPPMGSMRASSAGFGSPPPMHGFGASMGGPMGSYGDIGAVPPAGGFMASLLSQIPSSSGNIQATTVITTQASNNGQGNERDEEEEEEEEEEDEDAEDIDGDEEEG